MAEHVANVTKSIMAIPAERRRDKVTRTIGGVLLAAAGFGILYALNGNLLPKNLWLERVGIAAIALGCLSSSLEFVKLPIDYGIAVAKTILDLARGKS